MRTALTLLFSICFATVSSAQLPKVEVPKVPELPTQEQTQAACTSDDQCCCNTLNQFQCTLKSVCETTGGKCEADDKCK